jgi:hypothetical protein
MKKAETKQLQEALMVLRNCTLETEAMAERAKERESFISILKQLQTLVEPLEIYDNDWANKFDDLSERQQESPRGEAIADIAGTYENIVEGLTSVIHDIEYLINYDI